MFKAKGALTGSGFRVYEVSGLGFTGLRPRVLG